ncbi:MAG: hypothetical protein ACJ8AW_31175 [Rhodopila sp.]
MSKVPYQRHRRPPKGSIFEAFPDLAAGATTVDAVGEFAAAPTTGGKNGLCGPESPLSSQIPDGSRGNIERTPNSPTVSLLGLGPVTAMVGLPSLAHAQSSVMPYASGWKQFLYYDGTAIGDFLIIVGIILCLSPVVILMLERDWFDFLPPRSVFWSGGVLCIAGLVVLTVRAVVLD